MCSAHPEHLIPRPSGAAAEILLYPQTSPIHTELQAWAPGTSAGGVIWIAGVHSPQNSQPHIPSSPFTRSSSFFTCFSSWDN